MDSHLTEGVKAVANKHAKIAVIPGGMTKLLQPLDISVNKSFKSRIRLNWEKWMNQDKKEFTKSGRRKRATYAEVCKWVIDSWNYITSDTIRNGFKKPGLINYQNKDADENEEMSNGMDERDENEQDDADKHNEVIDDLNEAFEFLIMDSDESFDGF